MKLKHPTTWLESKPKLAWTFTIAYAILIFVLSSFPYGPPEPDILEKVSATFKHILEYSVLGFLLLASFRSSKKTKKYAFCLAILFTTFYGVTDEFHQLFVPFRTASIMDILADAFGGFFGAFFLRPEIFKIS